MNPSSPSVRKLLALLYLAGLVVLADQAADLLAAMLTSPAPSLASWRFGAFGIVASRVSVFLVGDIMLFTAAIGLEHRRVLRLLGWLHLLLALLFLAALGLFVLDSAEVHGRRPAGSSRAIDLAALRAGGVMVVAILLMAWGATSALRASKVKGRAGRHEGEATPLLTDIRRDETPS